MTVLTRDLFIALPPEVLWSQLLDVGAWPRWMAHVIESGWTDPGTPKPGSRLWFRFQHNQKSPVVFAQVTDLRPARELAYKPVGGDPPYTDGMTGIEWQWLLFGRPGGGTDLRFTLSYEAEAGLPFFRELTGTRIQGLNMADSSLLALRAMAEGRVPAAERGEA